MRSTAKRAERRLFVAVGLVAAVLVPGPWGAVRAEDEHVPGACTPNGPHVVTPGCVPALTGDARDAASPVLEPGITYPNLVPNVTELIIGRPFVSFDPETGEFTWGPPTLFFDTHAQNFGAVSVDLLNDEPTDVENPAVSQCVSWTGDVCRARQRIGGFELHPDHGHFHFQDFAKYELRAVLADGTPDWSAAGLKGSSDKVSFCLVDSAPVADGARPVPTYVLCSSVREGISPGWTDIYTSDLPGQQFEIGDLPDGRYALVVEMNYGNDLLETDYDDNTLVVTLDISGDRHDVTIVDRSWS